MEAAVAEAPAGGARKSESKEQVKPPVRFAIECTVAREALNKALANLIGVVEKRNTIPILSNVLLTTVKRKKGPGTLALKVTDLDREVEQMIPADVELEGSLTISAHTFSGIAQDLPETADIRLFTDKESQLKIKSGRSSFELYALPADDFPNLKNDLPKTKFEIDAPVLRNLLTYVSFAMATEETRYYLCGVYLHVHDGNKLRGVATDGHRLGCVEAECPEGAEEIPGVIIPSKTVSQLLKILAGQDGTVLVTLDTRQIQFTVGDVHFTSKLIDGTYPDYTRVIPTANGKVAVTKPEFLLKATKRVSRISSEKGRAVKFNFQDGVIIVSSSNPEKGSAVEEVDVNYSHDPLEIGFNSRYVRDILELIENGDVIFNLHDNSSPTLVLDGEHPERLYVLMPMRV